jgi:hypothetical protein
MDMGLRVLIATMEPKEAGVGISRVFMVTRTTSTSQQIPGINMATTQPITTLNQYQQDSLRLVVIPEEMVVTRRADAHSY